MMLNSTDAVRFAHTAHAGYYGVLPRPILFRDSLPLQMRFFAVPMANDYTIDKPSKFTSRSSDQKRQ
jgi:hypothetical protein